MDRRRDPPHESAIEPDRRGRLRELGKRPRRDGNRKTSGCDERGVARVVFVPMRDDDATYRLKILIQEARELARNMGEARVDEHTANQIRTHVVADQATSPARHANARHVIMPFDRQHPSESKPDLPMR